MFDSDFKSGSIRFTKMHGIGNDYVYIDCLKSEPRNLPQLAVAMSDRHTGVGGDGIILILPSDVADFRMRIFNADGSEAKMCGNGSRCVARYVADHGLTDSDTITLETLAGIRTLTINRTPSGTIDSVTVDMGSPSFIPSEIGMTVEAPEFINRRIDNDTTITAVGMGNPHGVVFLTRDDFERLDIASRGPRLENSPLWTDRANIEFAVVGADRSTIDMRVWERGSGETMACGTGACAVAVAAAATGRSGRDVTVRLRGGDLAVSWRESDGHVMMTGGATPVFEGVYPLPDHLLQKSIE